MLEEEEVGRVGVYFRNGRRNVSRSCAVEGSWKQTSPRQNSRRIVGYIYIHTTRSVVRKRDRERFTIVIYKKVLLLLVLLLFALYTQRSSSGWFSPLPRSTNPLLLAPLLFENCLSM